MIDDATLDNIERIVTGEYPCAYCPDLVAEIRRLREIRKCGKCSRDTVSGDCYGCETDRLQADLAAHRAVVRELVETLITTRAWWNLTILAHPLVQQAREEKR